MTVQDPYTMKNIITIQKLHMHDESTINKSNQYESAGPIHYEEHNYYPIQRKRFNTVLH